MKNRKLTAIVAMVVGAATLATAAFANNGNASGYTIYKNALKDLIKQENYTLNTSVRLLLDGEVYVGDTTNCQYDKNGDVILSRTTERKDAGEEHSYKSERYVQDGLQIYSTGDFSEDAKDKGYYVHPVDHYDSKSFSPIDLGFNDETEEKVIKFVETAADTFIGDLKNNFIMTDSNDNGSTYSINLESFQVPAIISSGMEMFSAAFKESLEDTDISSNSQEDIIMQLLSSNPQIQNASCTVTVDSEGRLSHNLLSGSLEGAGHTLTLEIEINASDYGTTKPQRLDLDSAPNVEYSKNMSKKKAVVTTDGEEVNVDVEAED